MVGRIRAVALLLVAVVALQVTAVPAARAANPTMTTDTGALRVAQVIIRRALPWVLAIVEELLEQLPPGTPPPQPPPVAPGGDPDFTP